MIFSIIVIFVIGFLSCTPHVYAISDPLSVANNKYGIHVAELTDLPDAAKLVNSNGGDWGYVTLVIQDGDRNTGKWQEIFNQMRRLHLIPIIRLATHPEGDSWKIPQKEDAKRWASFLNDLNWPVENRYVVLFNEPNHSKEWGNTINPEEYADVALEYAKTLKGASADFFILPAGLDMSARSDGEALEGSEYLRRMQASHAEFFSAIDGWTSHSYPNPGFQASPYGSGKGSMASFQWELSYLQSLDVTKSYPVFITETGWAHNQGVYPTGGLTPQGVGNNLILATSGVWRDQRIAAITPFLLNYQGRPFDVFSWKKLNSSEYFPQYGLYQSIVKTNGNPSQRESFSLKKNLFPGELIINSSYTLETEITNTGQGILDPNDGYSLSITGLPVGSTYSSDPLPILEPNEKGSLKIQVHTPIDEGKFDVIVGLKHNQKDILIEKKALSLIPPPSLSLIVSLGWKKVTGSVKSQILVYDMNNLLIHKFVDVPLINGKISVTGLYGIIPGEKYRIVVVVPYYLPRQQMAVLKEKATDIHLKRMLPVDFNNDGALDLKDIPAFLFTKPNQAISRIF